MKKVGSAVRRIALLVVIAMVASCGVAYAAEWPEKRIEMIWHSAGSGGDIFLRALAKAVSTKIPTPVIVNNITGASGANSWTHVARSKPDGYTIQGVSSTFIASPIVNNMKVSYKDFDAVARMFIDAVAIYVAADAPYQTLNDFLDDAKKRPGELKITGGTAGNIEFVATRELMKAAGVNVALVPFEGGGDGVVAVLGGHITAGVGEFAEMLSSVEGGKIRVLATFNKIPGYDYQTVAEAGFPQVTIEKFRGLIVSKGTPKEVLEKLREYFKAAYDNPDFKQYYESSHLVPAWLSGEEFYKVMEEQDAAIRTSLGK
ncbi:MAG: tripartite tricarboxylate transporter substrate binding protein [Synergistaceae bacterium]|jgi:tripartite-type tricarboxylate transporter receptor subunit TctC|nr:tripartite tricarboxylate transporter substrate binding protein [Synergistaceae bacterium]